MDRRRLGASSDAANHLAADATTVATFDPDALYDYRSRRPVLDVIDGVLRHLAWPELAVRRLHVDDRDLLILHGPEPDFRWRELAGRHPAVRARGRAWSQWVTLGAIPAATPHTRPTPVFATASREGLLRPGHAAGPRRPAAGSLGVPVRAGADRERGRDPHRGVLRAGAAVRGRPVRDRARSRCSRRWARTSASRCRWAASPMRRATQRASPRCRGRRRRTTPARWWSSWRPSRPSDDEADPLGRRARVRDRALPAGPGRTARPDRPASADCASVPAQQRRRGGEAGQIPALSRNCRSARAPSRPGADEPGRPARRTG